MKTVFALFAALTMLACGGNNDELKKQLAENNAWNRAQSAEIEDLQRAAEENSYREPLSEDKKEESTNPSKESIRNPWLAKEQPAVSVAHVYRFNVGGSRGKWSAYMNANPQPREECGGKCWVFYNMTTQKFYIQLYVNGREQTVFDGYAPIIRFANALLLDGRRQAMQISVLPPDGAMRFDAGDGSVEVRAVLYSVNANSGVLNPVGTWTNRVSFPFWNGDPVGAADKILGPHKWLNLPN